LAAVSRKSAISHYNINGNILGEDLKQEPQSLPFQLPGKRIRVRQKDKLNSKVVDYFEPTTACESVNEMKRRISLRREISNDGFIRLNT
jgi:hypothetical protein